MVAKMIYVTQPRHYRIQGSPNRTWSKLLADSVSELHQAADAVGALRCWFQRNPPRYELTPERRQAALALGAKEVTANEAWSIVRGMTR